MQGEYNGMRRHDVSIKTSNAYILWLHSQLEETDWDALTLGLKRYVRCRDLAHDEIAIEDIISDVYIEASEGKTCVEQAKSRAAYLKGVAKLLLLDRLKKLREQQKHEISLSELKFSGMQEEEEECLAHTQKTECPSTWIEWNVEEDLVSRMYFEHLVSHVSSPTYRSILQRLWDYDMDRGAVAHELGGKPHSAYVKIERACASFRKIFQDLEDSPDG